MSFLLVTQAVCNFAAQTPRPYRTVSVQFLLPSCLVAALWCAGVSPVLVKSLLIGMSRTSPFLWMEIPVKNLKVPLLPSSPCLRCYLYTRLIRSDSWHAGKKIRATFLCHNCHFLFLWAFKAVHFPSQPVFGVCKPLRTPSWFCTNWSWI